MIKTKTKSPNAVPAPNHADTARDVLTLTEAADYLRLSTDDVLQLVREQGLPARQMGTHWRFLKTAIQQWLNQPLAPSKSDGIWAAAGSWKDDPYLEDMLKETYRRRGRSMTEEG
jgi:excisionase family DNA binding protein